MFSSGGQGCVRWYVVGCLWEACLLMTESVDFFLLGVWVSEVVILSADDLVYIFLCLLFR